MGHDCGHHTSRCKSHQFQNLLKSRLVTYVFDKRTWHLYRGPSTQCMQHCVPRIKDTLEHDRANRCKFTLVLNLMLVFFLLFFQRRHNGHLENLVSYEHASTPSSTKGHASNHVVELNYIESHLTRSRRIQIYTWFNVVHTIHHRPM